MMQISSLSMWFPLIQSPPQTSLKKIWGIMVETSNVWWEHQSFERQLRQFYVCTTHLQLGEGALIWTLNSTFNVAWNR
jgi:hypothetical protein